MNLKNFIIYAIIITIVCIGYVNQQLEIFKISYKLREKEKSLSEIVDHHQILLYNNTCLKAPQYLSYMLKVNALDLTWPDTESVGEVKIVRKEKTQIAKSGLTIWKSIFSDLVIPKAQAAFDKGK